MVVVAVGGARPPARRSLRPPIVRPHEPGHAVLAAGVAVTLEFLGHPWATGAGFLALAERLDFGQQPGVGRLPGRGGALPPGLVAGAAHAQGPA